MCMPFSAHTGHANIFLICRKIWIRTAHAWYELGSPSKTYEPYYRNYWIRWCLVYLICDAIRKSDDDEEEPDPPTTWSDFIKSLHHSRSGPEEAAEARRVLGRPLRSEDFFAYVCHLAYYIFSNLISQYCIMLFSAITFSKKSCTFEKIPLEKKHLILTPVIQSFMSSKLARSLLPHQQVYLANLAVWFSLRTRQKQRDRQETRNRRHQCPEN